MLVDDYKVQSRTWDMGARNAALGSDVAAHILPDQLILWSQPYVNLPRLSLKFEGTFGSKVRLHRGSRCSARNLACDLSLHCSSLTCKVVEGLYGVPPTQQSGNAN